MDDTHLTYRPGDATIWRDDELVADVRVEHLGPMLASAPALLAACEGAYVALLQSLPATRSRLQREIATLRDAIAGARGQSPEKGHPNDPAR